VPTCLCFRSARAHLCSPCERPQLWSASRTRSLQRRRRSRPDLAKTSVDLNQRSAIKARWPCTTTVSLIRNEYSEEHYVLRFANARKGDSAPCDNRGIQFSGVKYQCECESMPSVSTMRSLLLRRRRTLAKEERESRILKPPASFYCSKLAPQDCRVKQKATTRIRNKHSTHCFQGYADAKTKGYSLCGHRILTSVCVHQMCTVCDLAAPTHEGEGVRRDQRKEEEKGGQRKIPRNLCFSGQSLPRSTAMPPCGPVSLPCVSVSFQCPSPTLSNSVKISA
jgi:hypothetical protein